MTNVLSPWSKVHPQCEDMVIAPCTVLTFHKSYGSYTRMLRDPLFTKKEGWGEEFFFSFGRKQASMESPDLNG